MSQAALMPLPPGGKPVARDRAARLALRCCALLVMVVTCSTSLAVDDAPAASLAGTVNFYEGQLSVAAKNVSLVTLLREVGDLAGFDVIAHGDLDGLRGSWSFVDLPLQQGIGKLLRHTSSIVSYQPGGDTDAGPKLTRIYLLGSSAEKTSPIRIETVELGLENQVRTDQVEESDIQTRLDDIARAEGLTDEITLDNLAFALQHDPEPNVRIMAISALVSIGGTDAVTALEAGMGDTDAAVRAKVVQAFAALDDERIPLWLGQVLMGDPEPEVRLEALRAMARKEGDMASVFIEAALADSSSLVSEAATQLIH